MSVAVASVDQFSIHMERVARKLLGDPNPRLSTKTELRFGTHGSLSVDLDKGVWADHEAETGGGVMDLLAREQGLKGQDAIAWLRQECGAQFEDRSQPETSPRARIVATYPYVDEDGEILFEVCRFEPKTFKQRRPDGEGWSWSVRGIRQVPYRLQDLQRAIRIGEMVFIVEGEKDVEALNREGLCATCNAMGAGKWTDTLAEHFTGARVVILPDNDDAGRSHASQVAASLIGVAKRVAVLELPELPHKGDVSDWLAAGGDGVVLMGLAHKAKPWTPEPPQSAFGAIPWAAIDAVSIRQDWLIADLMFCGDVGMIYGASGSGKSFLAVHMGLCIARGVPFLGHDTRKGAVLYQAGEGGKGLVKRLRAYKQDHCVTEDLPFVLLPSRIDLFKQDGDLEAFIAECRAWKAAMQDPLALIVVDTFSTASPGANENASEDMSRLINAGEAINKATGAALMWVHHKNAAGDRERGHTSLRANIDTAIEVTKDEESNARTARLVKLKDGEDGLKLGFELHPVTVGTYDDGKPITSCVVVPAQAEPGQASKRRPLPRGQQRFLKTLDTAVSQYGGVVPGNGAYGVNYATFRDLFVTTCGQGMTPTAVRQTLSRDGNELWLADLIGRDDNWLWITERGGIYL
jgi:hypothetical protein